jgi:hypothetical protein
MLPCWTPTHSAPYRQVALSSNPITPLRSPMATPVAPDHALVVPRRHVASIFDVATEKQTALWDLVAHVRGALVQAYTPTAPTSA